MNPYNTTGTIIRTNKSENTVSIPIVIPTTPITIITTEVPDVSDTTVPVDNMQQTPPPPPQITRAKSFLMFVDKLEQYILRLLFGPSMQMPPCPFKPPSMWGNGWKLYLRIALWAMPSTVALSMAAGVGISIIIIIAYYILIGVEKLCDWCNEFLPAKTWDDGSDSNAIYDYETRKNNLKETRNQFEKRNLLKMRLATAGFAVVGFIPISMLILDTLEMKTKYKTMTACKFATHLGRSGISLSCGLGLFYLFGAMLVEDPFIKEIF